MKIKLLLITFSFVLNTFGQSKSVEKIFSEYLGHIKNYDTEMTNYLHPQYFSIQPKDSIIKAIKEFQSYMLSDAGKEILIAIDTAQVETISDFVIENKVSYCLIESTIKTKVNINKILESEGGEFAVKLMQAEYIQEFGEKNVIYDNLNHRMTLIEHRKDLGIKETESTGWKFLEIDESTQKLIESTIPKTVRDTLINKVFKE